MAHNQAMPHMGCDLYLSYLGAETDITFNQGIDLPGFASYPLLESDAGREILNKYYSELIEIGRQCSVGVIIDSATWVANRDRGARIHKSPRSLERLNIEAIDMIAQMRKQVDDVSIILCAQVGPRCDGYAPVDLMTAKEAESYHTEQIETLSGTDADFICGSTIFMSIRLRESMPSVGCRSAFSDKLTSTSGTNQENSQWQAFSLLAGS